nr:hypothetical protein [Acidobacteriota bacterium]
VYARAAVALAAVSFSAYASASAAPHFRLYTNALGGGRAAAGRYFPHDEFYDASTRETAEAVARLAPEAAAVANETPELFAHYLRLAGRADLRSVSLSDREALRTFGEGDVVVVARGRRYFSNDEVTSRLQREAPPGRRHYARRDALGARLRARREECGNSDRLGRALKPNAFDRTVGAGLVPARGDSTNSSRVQRSLERAGTSPAPTAFTNVRRRHARRYFSDNGV